MNKTLKMLLYSIAFVMIPVFAFGAEAASPEAASDIAIVAKYTAAGLCLIVSAIVAGVTQMKIGMAGCGTLAERPEVGTTIIVLQALPEIIVLLGFVGALILGG